MNLGQPILINSKFKHELERYLEKYIYKIMTYRLTLGLRLDLRVSLWRNLTGISYPIIITSRLHS